MKRSLITAAIAPAGALLAISATAATDLKPGARQLQIVKTISPAAGVKTPDEQELAAYLMVYFKDETHSIYFATSTDGYTFTDEGFDANGGKR